MPLFKDYKLHFLPVTGIGLKVNIKQCYRKAVLCPSHSWIFKLRFHPQDLLDTLISCAAVIPIVHAKGQASV